MPLIVVTMFAVIPALVLTIMAGITGLSEKDYGQKMNERAKSSYHQSQTLPSTVTFLCRNLPVNVNKVDLSEIKIASYQEILTKKVMIEQAMANVCLTLYTACGLDSRLTPVYNAIRYANLSSNYSVTVSPHKNGHLSFNSTITGGGNSYVYYGIWSGAYTIVAGDTLVFSIYLPSGLPNNTAGGIEMDFSDGSFGRSYIVTDQNGIRTYSGSASYSGKWIYRQFSLSPVVGKSIQYFNLVNEADTAGNYIGILYKTIQIVNGNTVKLRIWDPSYLWAFMDMADGEVSTLLTTGTTQTSITCTTATETEFNRYGKYLLRNALGAVAVPTVTLDGVARTFYYSKPAGGEGCGFSDMAELR